MIKINWQDAPDWANWAAMDASGFWYWYEDKPSYGVTGPNWRSDGWSAFNNNLELYVDRPQDTLTAKPTNNILTEKSDNNKIDTISTLKTYQAWRRGKLEGTLDELNLSPSKIGKAIDEAIRLLEGLCHTQE